MNRLTNKLKWNKITFKVNKNKYTLLKKLFKHHLNKQIVIKEKKMKYKMPIFLKK